MHDAEAEYRIAQADALTARENKQQAMLELIDAASGTFQARIDLPNANGALPSGIKCKVTLPGL